MATTPDLSPLSSGAHAGSLRLYGVRLGDAAAEVARDAITGADENDPGEPRNRHGDGRVFRIAADGSEIEVPLGERIAATLRKGGWLRCGPIALQVLNGRIDRIFVRGPALETLGIAAEADIARRFGPATARRRVLGARQHHYPARALVLSWHEGDQRLEHVMFGLDPFEEARLGAPALLTELLAAWDGLARHDWKEPPDGSERVRYQRVAALARALELGSVDELTAGTFLDRPLSPGRGRVLREIAQRGPDPDSARPSVASVLYRNLLYYRHDVDGVVHATRGWLICSDGALLGMIATQDAIGRQLAELMPDIDRWLCTLIDPEQRSFTLDELEARHGWPDVNLYLLEMEEA